MALGIQRRLEALAAEFRSHVTSSSAAIRLHKMTRVNNKPSVNCHAPLKICDVIKVFMLLIVNCCCGAEWPQNKHIGFKKSGLRLCETVG